VIRVKSLFAGILADARRAPCGANATSTLRMSARYGGHVRGDGADWAHSSRTYYGCSRAGWGRWIFTNHKCGIRNVGDHAARDALASQASAKPPGADLRCLAVDGRVSPGRAEASRCQQFAASSPYIQTSDLTSCKNSLASERLANRALMCSAAIQWRSCSLIRAPLSENPR